MSVQIEFDARNMIRTMRLAERDIVPTQYRAITRNAQIYLGNVVVAVPRRTGNMASAARPSWEHLHMPGLPGTTLPPGVKTVTITMRSGRQKELELKSRGDFVDRRRDGAAAMFRFRMSAWERRRNPATGRKIWRGYSWFHRYGRQTLRRAGNFRFDFRAFEKLMKKYSE